MMRKKVLTLCILPAFLFLTVSLLADKTGVSIEAPATAKKGSDVTVTIRVTHDGNNFLHYTDRVVVKVNGKEFKKWKYSAFNKPDDEKFILKFTVTVNGDTVIEAEGNCNLHGSRGKASHTIKAL